MIKINKYYLNLIFFSFIFLSLNLIFIFLYPSASGDAYTIKLVAKNILDNFCISLSIPESGECKAHWGSNQGPGYPLIIAYSFYFFGENFLPIRIFQLVFHMFSIFLLILQIKKFYKIKPQNIILIILFISPITMGWHRSILTESINFSLVLILTSILIPLFNGKNINSILLGLIITFGFYIRYDFVFFIAPIALLLFLKLTFKNFILTSIKISLISTILVAPYLYRNYKVGLDIIPPTQIGLHLEEGPSSPIGYIDWVTTWSSTNYMYANALYPLDYGNYNEIKISKKAYFNEKQEKEILKFLNSLKKHNGKPIPEEIDQKFKDLAKYNRENYSFYVYILLPAKRIIALWLNPVTSLGFPGSFNNTNITYDYLINLDFLDKINFLKDNFFVLVTKIINFLYRMFLLFGLGYIIYYSFYQNMNKLKPIIYFASSHILLKSVFLSFTFYTATRHIIPSAILIEILIILFLLENKTK